MEHPETFSVCRQIQYLQEALCQNAAAQAVLAAAGEMASPGWYCGAGGVAPTVWNLGHGVALAGIKDYKLVYFDSAGLSTGTERQIEDDVAPGSDGDRLGGARLAKGSSAASSHVPPLVDLFQCEPHAAELGVVAQHPVDEVNAELGSSGSGGSESLRQSRGRVGPNGFVAVRDGGSRSVAEASKAASERHLGRLGSDAVSQAEHLTVRAGGHHEQPTWSEGALVESKTPGVASAQVESGLGEAGVLDDCQLQIIHGCSSRVGRS